MSDGITDMMNDNIFQVEQIIIDWLKSGNENTTYLAELINTYYEEKS